MKINISILIGILILPVSQVSSAADVINDFSIASAMGSEKAKSELAGVKYYFGNQKHGKVKHRFGVHGTTQRTNAFNKTHQEACEWVFLAAMKRLKNKALSLGANAVINIKSNYANNLTSSNETYKCGVGTFVSRVSLQGEFVTLK